MNFFSSQFSVGLSDDPVQRTKEGLEVNQNDPLNKLSKKKLHSFLLIFFSYHLPLLFDKSFLKLVTSTDFQNYTGTCKN